MLMVEEVRYSRNRPMFHFNFTGACLKNLSGFIQGVNSSACARLFSVEVLGFTTQIEANARIDYYRSQVIPYQGQLLNSSVP
jgi:hypothetical protein